MIELYTADTPNGHRVEFMLEEVALPYRKHSLSLVNGDHRTATFHKLNPSSRIPVITDEEFVLTQSTAILLYLAEKSGKLLPVSPQIRAKAMEWLSFDATDMAPTRFDAFLLTRHGQDKAAEILRQRAVEFYAVYDQHLSNHEYLAGAEYSVADVAAYPWARSMEHPAIRELQHLQRWMGQMSERPACLKLFTQ
ncbi:MAG: glutathione S-transferase family protein [Candidatus Thiodiazotropha taylori]